MPFKVEYTNVSLVDHVIRDIYEGNARLTISIACALLAKSYFLHSYIRHSFSIKYVVRILTYVGLVFAMTQIFFYVVLGCLMVSIRHKQWSQAELYLNSLPRYQNKDQLASMIYINQALPLLVDANFQVKRNEVASSLLLKIIGLAKPIPLLKYFAMRIVHLDNIGRAYRRVVKNIYRQFVLSESRQYDLLDRNMMWGNFNIIGESDRIARCNKLMENYWVCVKNLKKAIKNEKNWHLVPSRLSNLIDHQYRGAPFILWCALGMQRSMEVDQPEKLSWNSVDFSRWIENYGDMPLSRQEQKFKEWLESLSNPASAPKEKG